MHMKLIRPANRVRARGPRVSVSHQDPPEEQVVLGGVDVEGGVLLGARQRGQLAEHAVLGGGSATASSARSRVTTR
jgi:hypothetical protein